MAKGGVSAKLRWLGADLLEGRLLLSRVPIAATEHALASTPIHVSPARAAPRADTEPSHTASSPSDNSEVRDAEERAAPTATLEASTTGPNLSFPTSGRPTDDFDDSLDSAQGTGGSARYFRVTYREEPVAWRLAVEWDRGVGPVSRHRVDVASEIPDSASRVVGGMQAGRVSSGPTAVESPEVMPSPERSDLLADFLPSDREALDRAIDGLLDGLGGLVADSSDRAEASTLIPSPVAWGFALAVLEAARLRLRRRSGQRAEGEQGPEAGRGDGFLAFRG